MTQPQDNEQHSFKRLDKDLRLAAKSIPEAEVRYLVDEYYTMQHNRIRSDGQVRSRGNEPHSVVAHLASNNRAMEAQIKVALDIYTTNDPVGQWMRNQRGIGPVIAAGFLAHLDITRAATAGHFWSYAGLIDRVAWLGGKAAEKAVLAIVDKDAEIAPADFIAIAARLNCDPKWLARRALRAASDEDIGLIGLQSKAKEHDYIAELTEGVIIKYKHLVEGLSRRPWNAKLKTLCWKLGESFVKQSSHDNCFYGKIYTQRKADETRRCDSGEYAATAERILAERNFGDDTKAKQFYAAGMLPPAHIHARAKRFAVKLFLAHLHEKMYQHHYNTAPPIPYIIAIGGHDEAHYIPPPD